MRLGQAVGRVLKRDQDRPSVLIGKDTRISGYMLESAMEAGLVSVGVDVMLTGPLPTPGVAYLTRAQRQSLGVVISASHNPFHDNGIKFFSAKGEKLPDAWELDVEAALTQAPAYVDSRQLGKARKLTDARGRYVEFCKSCFGTELSLKGLKIVVDAAHGAAYHVAPDVFHELGAEVIAIGCSPDGFNINEGFGATAPQALQRAVEEHGAHYGVALDGDADRLQLVDAKGRLFNGDELLYLMVQDRLAQGMAVPGAVGTLMTNMAVEVALRRQGVGFVRAKVGDRYVLEELVTRGWQLGGEGSGHLLALDKHTTGDGIVSCLLVLQSVIRTGRSLADQLAEVQLFPQHMINVRLLLGGRPGMISGAAGSMAVVIVALVVQHGVQYLLATVLLSGVLMMVFGALRLGKLVRMVPHPVMLGFVNGLAIIIAMAQLEHFKNGEHWLQGSSLWLMLGLVALTMAIVYGLPKLTRSVPPALVAILGVGLLSYGLQLPTRTLGDMAHIAGGLPSLVWPDIPWSLATLRIIAPYALLMALVGLLETLLTLNLTDEITQSRGPHQPRVRGLGCCQYGLGFGRRHGRLRHDWADGYQPQLGRSRALVRRRRWGDDFAVCVVPVTPD
jgi:phosphoglucosamine mutase